jgi:hypothetical protein
MARLDTPNVTAEAPITFYYIIQQLYLEEIPSQPFSELAGQQYIIHLAIVCVKRTNYFSQCRFA